MDARPRRAVPSIAQPDIPSEAGVYAFYRDGKAIYVGKAGSLRIRLWRYQLGHGQSLTGAAFRRNVAEWIGISTAAAIKRRAYQPDDAELAAIRAFIEECEIAWIAQPSDGAATDLEARMKAEWKPPLTRI